MEGQIWPHHPEPCPSIVLFDKSSSHSRVAEKGFATDGVLINGPVRIRPMFYLASKSPRRRQLLESVGLVFSVLELEIDERMREVEAPEQAVQRLAREKAAVGVSMLRDDDSPFHPVMAADTMVVIGNEVLGKPLDADDAYAMLERLSGRTHRVLTAVAVHDEDSVDHRISESLVTMKPLTRWEIERYWASGEPADKAGGYAIQGLGSGIVTRLEGSYSGVVGLPLYETRELLATVGIDWL